MSYKYAKMTDRELNQEAAQRILKAKELAAKWWVWEEDGQKRAIHISAFRPATDRNQSGELLIAMRKRGVKFLVQYSDDPGVDFFVGQQWHRHWREDVVEQPTARDETIAALKALDALEEKTK